MKRTINFLAAATLVLAAVPMFAATANAPLAVSATVAQNCTITTSPVAFGAYDTVTGTAVSGTGAVNVACTMGSTGLTIDLNTGANGLAAVGTTRAMKSGAAYLNYDLYTENTHTTLWATGVTIPDAPSKASRPFTVYGLIAANQDVAAGAYSDTVTATLNY